MDFIKISIWLFLTLTSVCISECKSYHKYHILDEVRNTNNENNDNCFCFKKNGSYHKVPDMLAQKKENLEKIIVYLYRDKITDDIKMYVPNDEKQALIPDLAFEVGDKLVSVGDEKIKDIFIRDRNTNESPYQLKPHENTPSPEINWLDEQIDDKYIDNPDIDSHKDLEPEINTHESEINNNLTIEDIIVPETYNSIKPQMPADHSFIHIPDHDEDPHVDMSGVPIEYPKLPLPGKEISPDATLKPDSPSIIDTFVDHQPNVDWNILPEVIHDKVLKPLHFDTNIDLNIPIGDISGNNIKQNIPSHTSKTPFVIPNLDWSFLPEYSQLLNHHGHAKQYPYYKHDGKYPSSHSTKPSEPSEQYEFPGEIPDGWMSTETSTLKIDISDVETYPEIDSVMKQIPNDKIEPSEESIFGLESQPTEEKSSLEMESSERPDSNEISEETDGTKFTSPHNEYETFDRWFIRQMQRFRTYTEHDRAINLAVIERYIRKILNDHGMHVTTEGVLTNSFGTALDVRNLHLRPILIGNSLTYGSLMHTQKTDLIVPANMPYLQAILVTNAHPSMILGMIPIGKTVIPSSSLNTFTAILKPKVKYSWSKPTLHRILKIQKYPGLVKRPVAVNLSKKTRPIHKHGQSIVTLLKKAPLVTKSMIGHRQPVTAYNANRLYSIARDKSVQAVNKLYSSLDNNDSLLNSAEATKSLLEALRGNSMTASLLSSLQEEGEESASVSDEHQDIEGRIVGGSAATGSGTPLSVKGRIKDIY